MMIPNLPVSENVEPLFYEKLKNLPPGIAKQLRPLQVYNPNYTTIAALEKEKEWIDIQRSLLLNNLLTELNDNTNNRLQDAIMLLENKGTDNANMILAATYLKLGYYDEAEAKLELQPEEEPDMNDFIRLHQILINAYKEDSSIKIDSTDMQFIYDLAHQCPPNIAIVSARTLVRLLFGEEVPICPVGGNKSMTVYLNNNVNKNENGKKKFTWATIIPIRFQKAQQYHTACRMM
ncbi:MAG: hypothetical protein Kow00102_18110 [Spirochaetota bacterium]